MLLPNNPDLPTGEIEQKCAAIVSQRRRDKPLLSKSAAAAIHKIAATPLPEPRGLRAFIKRLPLVGPLALGTYRTLRQLRTPGMGWKQKLRLVPGLGSFALWVHSLLRMNAIRAQLAHELAELRQMQASQAAAAQTLSSRIDNFDRVDIARRLNEFDRIDIANRLANFDRLDLENRLQHFDRLDLENRLQHLDRLDLENRLRQFDKINIDNRLHSIESLHMGVRADRIEDTLHKFEDAVRDIQMRNRERDQRLAALIIEVRSKIQRAAVTAAAPPVWNPPAFMPTATPAQPEAVDLNSFYFEFEALFRGSRESIKQRQTVYLDYLKDLPADPGARGVDVGCGRGEFLELLKEHGIACTGIDLNMAMVDECQSLGLTAFHADAIAYLRSQPENSLAVVSGFHIIEHLPFEKLIELFDASLHALRPGGVLIFETPNPENLVVGACNFYYDPTHLHPIVPAVAEFMARQRGFASAEILRLHPFPEDHMIAEDSEAARRLNKALYGPQDYAVIARKHHAH